MAVWPIRLALVAIMLWFALWAGVAAPAQAAPDHDSGGGDSSQPASAPSGTSDKPGSQRRSADTRKRPGPSAGDQSDAPGDSERSNKIGQQDASANLGTNGPPAKKADSAQSDPSVGKSAADAEGSRSRFGRPGTPLRAWRDGIRSAATGTRETGITESAPTAAGAPTEVVPATGEHRDAEEVGGTQQPPNVEIDDGQPSTAEVIEKVERPLTALSAVLDQIAARARLVGTVDAGPPLAVQGNAVQPDESIAGPSKATHDLAFETEVTPSVANALDRLGVLDTLTTPEARTTGVNSAADDSKPTPLDAIRKFVDDITAKGRALLTHFVKSSEGTPAAYPVVSAAAITSQFSQPLGGNVVNVVGTLLFNIIGAAMHVISGPANLPPGSNVTVRTSTLTLPNSGQLVRADWYFPDEVDDSTRLIYLQHGFMATGPMYSYTAAYLAEHTNSIVVAPTLSSNPFDAHGNWLGGAQLQQSVADLFAGDRAELTESASAAAGHHVTLPDSFVMVGHSLGGALVSGAAGYTVNNGAIDALKGVVLLDGVDVTGTTVPEALATLSGDNYRPVYDVSSERYVWSLHGAVGDILEQARPGAFNGVMLVGGRHIDGARGGNPLLQFAEYVIAGFSQPQNSAASDVLAAGWINDMFNETQTSGIYGDPREELPVPTGAGTATAVVLPFASPDSVVATPWDGIAEVILTVVFGLAGYDLSARPTPVDITM